MVISILFFLVVLVYIGIFFFLGISFYILEDEIITREYSTYQSLQESVQGMPNKGFMPSLLPEQSNSISIRFDIDTNYIYGRAKLNFGTLKEKEAFMKVIQPFYSGADKNGFSYITKDFDVFIGKKLKLMEWSSKSRTTVE